MCVYVSSNRITLITLRIFFTPPFRKKNKTDKVIRFIHVDYSPVNGHIQPVFILDHLLFCYLAGGGGVLRPIVKIRSKFQTEFYCYLFWVGDFIGDYLTFSLLKLSLVP